MSQPERVGVEHTTAMAVEEKRHLQKSLRRFDMLFFTICALIGLDIGTSGVKATAQELDAAADTLALYMAVRAGYSIDNAHQFWERLATQHPASVLNGYTAIHPATAFRLAAVDKVVQEVKMKQAARKPLLP